MTVQRPDGTWVVDNADIAALVKENERLKSEQAFDRERIRNLETGRNALIEEIRQLKGLK